MRFLRLLAILWLYSFDGVHGQGALVQNEVHYDIAQFWPGGFQAKMTIVIKKEIKFGWLIKLTFTSPVSSMEIFDAQVAQVSSDGHVYLLKHQNYNARLQTHQGQVQIFFTGTQPDGSSGPPNSDFLLIELASTFESVEDALRRVGTTLERDGTGNLNRVNEHAQLDVPHAVAKVVSFSFLCLIISLDEYNEFVQGLFTSLWMNP